MIHIQLQQFGDDRNELSETDESDIGQSFFVLEQSSTAARAGESSEHTKNSIYTYYTVTQTMATPSDFHAKVNKAKQRMQDSLRVATKDDSDTASVNSSRYQSSLAPSTAATSVNSGKSRYAEPKPCVAPPTSTSRPAARASARRDDLVGVQSPLKTFVDTTLGMMPVASDSSLDSGRRYTIEGPLSRGRAARRLEYEAHQRHKSSSPLRAQIAYDPASKWSTANEAASVRVFRENRAKRSKRESTPPTASQHVSQLRKPEDREPTAYVPEPVKTRRRSSLQSIKEAVGAFTEEVQDKAAKVRRRLSNRIGKALAPRETRPTDIQIIAKNNRDIDASPNLKLHRLPTAAEVYGTPTFFAKCSHQSPPAHLPLNDVPRTVRLDEGVLRYPNHEQKQILASMKEHADIRAPTVEVVDGRCAKCDLNNRRARETEALRAWNEKHDIFAQRLMTRRINYHPEWHQGFPENDLQKAGREVLIEALENKLIEVNKNREIAVAAIWAGFRERWGVGPAGIIPQKEKAEWAYGRTTPPNSPPKEDEAAKNKAKAGGTGFMRDGKLGGPMDFVSEPGRVRLQWQPKDTHVPKVPVSHREGQGLEWTEEEKALLCKDP